jgi:hypothetical protein
MKCGAELKNSGVFCPDCLAVMEKYPVNPNVVVKIPYRGAAAPPKKKRRYKAVNPEDQVRHLQKVCRRLSILLIVALLAFGSCLALLFLSNGNSNGIFDFGIGQNYGTEETQDTTDGT